MRDILARKEYTDRDILMVTLGLKDPSVFEGHQDLYDEVLANKELLKLAMVSCGKVLIVDPSNDDLIDLLLENGVDINSADKNGMTALHHAVQDFYNYREEPRHLIEKLLECGADLKVENNEGITPLKLAIKHSSEKRVIKGDKLIELVEAASVATPANTSYPTIFNKLGTSQPALKPNDKMELKMSLSHLKTTPENTSVTIEQEADTKEAESSYESPTFQH